MASRTLNASTLQRFNFLTIKNDVFGRRIKHRTATDGFAKRLAKMAQTRIPDFGGRFSDVVTTRAQQLGRAFHPQSAQIFCNRETNFARKDSPEFKRTAV